MEVRKILFFLLLIFAINYVSGKCNVQKLQKSSRENYLKSKLRGSNKIVCPELNNATFTDKSPFNILGLPHCLKNKVSIKLYMNDFLKTVCKLDIKHLPNWPTKRFEYTWLCLRLGFVIQATEMSPGMVSTYL